ncbi:MAG TPA: rhodanese-like domain-containing protein [Gallionellaceae bacterium]|nr:rhodanese-like domain-containing protein [Gallionellaceae bacterium]
MQYLQNNIWMVVVAISSGLMLLWSLFGNRVRGVKVVNTVEALELINHKNALVLDVREESEYKSGHLLNAKWIPLGRLAERIGELERYREQPIVVVCRSGARSASACAMLGKQGFTQAHNLSGGVMGWQKSNLPLEK